MKLDTYFIVLAVIVQSSNLYHVTEAQLDKECVVKDIIMKRDIQDEGSINLTFYIAPDDPMSLQIYFVGFEKYLDNDLLFLYPDRIWIQRKRNGDNTNYEISLFNKIPHGWNNITIAWKDRQLQLGVFQTMPAFEYEIEEISIKGKYITDCAKKTPVWEISKSDDVSIPLIGLSNLELQLSSDRPFQPEFVINAISVPFGFETELFYKKFGAPLPADDYRIAIVKHLNGISIFTIYESGKNQLISNTFTKEDLNNLSVRSLEGTFDLLLDVFVKDEFVVNTSVVKRSPEVLVTPTTSPLPITETTTMISESTSPDSTTENFKSAQQIHGKDFAPASSSNWQVTSVSLLANAAMLIIIIYLKKDDIIAFIKRMRPRNNGNMGFDMEDGKEPLLKGKVCQNALKETIRSKHTETHGQTNPSIAHHNKDICKMKLNSDKKNDSRKFLGDLDRSKPTKVILVVGGTGAGKSSFINGMANFIYGVEYEDSFRFKLVSGQDMSNSSANNSTEKLTAYAIPFMPGIEGNSNYIFIDTPGFGYARGLEEDKKWNEKFIEFLHENSSIKEVNGICFVIKRTCTRLTIAHKYVIEGLFSMFGRDIKNNIYCVVSHADDSSDSASHAPKLLEGSHLEYNIAINFSSDGLYNNIELELKSQKDIDHYFESHWALTMKGMRSFFDKLFKKNAVSLSLTNIVLEENKDIESLKDELSELSTKDQGKIDKKLMELRLKEAKKLDGRLRNYPCTENPLDNIDNIETLINDEENEDKRNELQRIKHRNIEFKEILGDKIKKSD